jgi:chromosome segregation ATPase
MTTDRIISKNGGQGTPVQSIDPASLPADRQKYIEFGILATQKTVAERDEAWATIEKQNQTIKALQTEISSLQALSGAMESRAASYQNIRDEAVAKRAEYEVLLRSISAQLREFNVKHEPLIKELREQRPSYLRSEDGDKDGA